MNGNASEIHDFKQGRVVIESSWGGPLRYPWRWGLYLPLRTTAIMVGGPAATGLRSANAPDEGARGGSEPRHPHTLGKAIAGEAWWFLLAVFRHHSCLQVQEAASWPIPGICPGAGKRLKASRPGLSAKLVSLAVFAADGSCVPTICTGKIRTIRKYKNRGGWKENELLGKRKAAGIPEQILERNPVILEGRIQS